MKEIFGEALVAFHLGMILGGAIVVAAILLGLLAWYFFGRSIQND